MLKHKVLIGIACCAMLFFDIHVNARTVQKRDIDETPEDPTEVADIVKSDAEVTDTQPMSELSGTDASKPDAESAPASETDAGKPSDASATESGPTSAQDSDVPVKPAPEGETDLGSSEPAPPAPESASEVGTETASGPGPDTSVIPEPESPAPAVPGSAEPPKPEPETSMPLTPESPVPAPEPESPMPPGPESAAPSSSEPESPMPPNSESSGPPKPEPESPIPPEAKGEPGTSSEALPEVGSEPAPQVGTESKPTPTETEESGGKTGVEPIPIGGTGPPSVVGGPVGQPSTGGNATDDTDVFPFQGGFVFDSPFFSFGQIEDYFRKLEKAMENIFRETMHDVNANPDVYKNTTDKIVEIEGTKYKVHTTVIRSGDENNAVSIEAVSAVPADKRRKRSLF